MKKLFHILYEALIQPRSDNDDGRRRESILNVLLLGSLVLSSVAFAIVAFNSFALEGSYGGESPFMAFVTALVFLVLIILSRRGLFMISSYALVAILFLLAFLTLYSWGILLPEGILILALAIIMASILLGTRIGALLTSLAAGGLILLGFLQQVHALAFNTTWMKVPGNSSDAIEFAFTLGVITTVSWLSNREIERSLTRAVRSEAELLKERDLLEVKVKERTKELEVAQREKVMELTRFAEFGRLTSSIIHELVTPLTTVALNLEQMHDEAHSEKLRRAIESTKRMERYIEAARKQLQNQSEKVEFSLTREIESAIEFLTPQADKHHVQIGFIKLDMLNLDGNPIKFHQMVTNLLANAIGAYESESKSDRRRVAVELWKVDDTVQLKVQDWGTGIPPQYMEKIFDPFFTLKKTDQGMGLGLSLVKEIVQNEFDGTIEVVSDKTGGTVFTVRIPLKSKHKHEPAAA